MYKHFYITFFSHVDALYMFLDIPRLNYVPGRSIFQKTMRGQHIFAGSHSNCRITRYRHVWFVAFIFNQVFRRKNLVIKMMTVGGRVCERQQFVSGA